MKTPPAVSCLLFLYLPVLFPVYSAENTSCMLPVPDPSMYFSQDDVATPHVKNQTVESVDECVALCCETQQCNAVTVPGFPPGECLLYACHPISVCSITPRTGISVFIRQDTNDTSHSTTTTSTTIKGSVTRTGTDPLSTSTAATTTTIKPMTQDVNLTSPPIRSTSDITNTTNSHDNPEETTSSEINTTETTTSTTSSSTSTAASTTPKSSKWQESTSSSTNTTTASLITTSTLSTTQSPVSRTETNTTTTITTTTSAPLQSTTQLTTHRFVTSTTSSTTKKDDEAFGDGEMETTTAAATTIASTITAVPPSPDQKVVESDTTSTTSTSTQAPQTASSTETTKSSTTSSTTSSSNDQVSLTPEETHTESEAISSSSIAADITTTISTTASTTFATAAFPTPAFISTTEPEVAVEEHILNYDEPPSNNVTDMGDAQKKLSDHHTQTSDAMTAVLICSLTFGCLFVLTVVGVLGKRVYDSYKKRHYSRLDYLINGMYN